MSCLWNGDCTCICSFKHTDTHKKIGYKQRSNLVCCPCAMCCAWFSICIFPVSHVTVILGYLTLVGVGLNLMILVVNVVNVLYVIVVVDVVEIGGVPVCIKYCPVVFTARIMI